MGPENASTTHSDNTARALRSGSPDARSVERLHRLLVSSVRDYAIFALDASGHIISWNAGARRIKGYEEHEIVGRHFSTFYSAEDVASGKPKWELEVAARDGQVEDEGWRIRKDGTRFWANVVITALRDEHGTLVGFAKVTRDLTERRASELQAIEDARTVAAAQAANRAKTEFLTMMSHELRTPLNAIGGYADLLAMGIGGKLSEEQRQYVERIRRSQHHLLAIISDLLDFGRIEAGETDYDITPVSLAAIVDNVAPMIEPQASARNVAFDRGDWPPDIVALADQAKAEQILLNVLSNAVKFTTAGGKISLSCETTADRVAILVHDTGIGIAPEKLESIFEPFVQLGRTLTTRHEGTGLGLSIARDLARAMGGNVTVASQLGEGSVFTVTLPRVG